MNIFKEYAKAIKKYFVFEGRSNRAEFFSFIGINFLGQMVLGSVHPVINLIFQFFIMIPSIAMYVRRMHDTGRSGWWCIVPVVSLIFACIEGDKDQNKYGTVPE